MWILDELGYCIGLDLLKLFFGDAGEMLGRTPTGLVSRLAPRSYSVLRVR